MENRYPAPRCRLLCARRERPCRRAAEQRDEVAPFQLIELRSGPLQPGPNYRNLITGSVGGPDCASALSWTSLAATSQWLGSIERSGVGRVLLLEANEISNVFSHAAQ